MSSNDTLPLAKDLEDMYTAKQAELRTILAKAGEQQERWKEILDLYKDRFFVPFSVKIDNQQDVILKLEAAKLSFSFKDEEDDIPEDKETLLTVLSRGERRAFYIMQILFEIEALKGNGQDNLIILDDVADSFDYQNKYAIIEYINDLHKDKATNFYTIILTHNFDFYRTVASRLGLGHKQVWMTIRDKHGNISLKLGQYRKDLFSYMMENCDKDKFFISLIPFCRNLIEYKKGADDPDYLLLTSCLHWKNNTEEICVGSVLGLFQKYINNGLINRNDNNERIINIIFGTSETIVNDVNRDPIAIENKIVLSIACRLKTEKFLKKCH